MLFSARMQDLEGRFAALAQAEGDVYLPNFTPREPVDAVLVGMEPSLGWWAKTPAEAAERVAAGFRNFMWSVEDFIMHYAARRYLCSAGQTYHVTDISKGAMTVDRAHVDRAARYSRWAALLEEELRLVAKPGARIVAIGREVRKVLDTLELPHEVTTVLHYSPVASPAREAAVKGRESEFSAFADSITMQDIIDTATHLLSEKQVPDAMTTETLARIRRATLTESRKKLAFSYSIAFSKPR